MLFEHAPSDAAQALRRIREADARTNAVARIIDEIPAHTPPGPLCGMPITVKETVNVAGHPTTGGSLSLSDHPQDEDAEVVRRLRAAGAVIVGKTTLSEMSGFVSTTLPPGFSERFGRTVNALHPGADPGGSSSGAAASVAAGFVPAAIGTETNGSVLIPALRQGTTGFKPSFGWMSLEGILPISHRFDTVGIVARNTDAAERVWRALGGGSADDAPDGTDCAAARRAPRIALDVRMPPELAARLSHIFGPIESRALPESEGGYRVLTSFDIRCGLDAWLGRFGGPGPRSFDEFFDRVRRRGHPYGCDRLEGAALLDARSEEDPRIRAALAVKEALSRAAAAALKGADVFASDRFSSTWALSGFPALAVRGFVLGAKPGCEALLLEAGRRIERAELRIEPRLP